MRANPFFQPRALLAVMLGAKTLTASAEDQNFAINAQPLQDALLQYSEVTGKQVFFSSGLALNLYSNAVKGQYSDEQALRHLLSGSGLSYRQTGANSITLEPVPPAKNVEEDTTPTKLPVVNVVDNAIYDASDPRNKDYSVPNSSAATKTDTPILETPVSVQVVPRAVINDQKSSTIKDALENVSSVRPQSSLGVSNAYIIRGFRNERVYRNGLIANGISVGSATEFDAANLDRIEVLKGPAAVLFGRVEPGGLINLVTKKPRDEAYYSLEQRFGSYGFFRTEWDATDAITQDKSLSYRFAGAYQSNESFRDFNFNDRKVFAPSITWRASEATEISVDLDITDQRYQVDRGLFAIGNRPAPIPISRSFIDPADPVDTNSKVNLGFNLTHAFNENWVLRNRFLASFVDDDNTSVKPANAFTAAQFLNPSDGNRLYLRNIFSQKFESETYTTNLDLTGKFDLLGTRHETLIGVDFLRNTGTYVTHGNFQNPVPGLALDIYNPVYGINPSFYATALATPFPPGSNVSFFRDEWYGLYFQDQITLWDKLHILGGGRYDWATTGRGRGADLAAAEANLPARTDRNFSPRVGISYLPWSWLSVYGNWTMSFGANNGVTATGATVNPEIGEQFETGIKSEFFDHRLSATLAYYHLTKQNVLTRDFTSPDPFAVAAIGEARSQGIEFGLSGQLTEEVSVIGNYAFTDARITKDFSGLQGHRLNNVPEHSGSLWLKYDIQHFEPLKGFAFGLGAFAVGQRQGDDDNSFVLPGYVRLDTFASYTQKLGSTRLITQINIRNLLDKTYYESTDPFNNAPPRVGIYPGAPLTAIGSVRLEY